MLNLYKETAFELQPAASTQLVEIQVPRANGSYDRSKFSKTSGRSDQLAKDDKAYEAKYLASSTSVFFRHSHAYPRSFLWRVLSDGKVLEISNADFARNEKNQEVSTVLRFTFQDKLFPRGVSVCDSSKSDDFHVFALTQENEVFELHIRTDYFLNADSVPKETKSWCSAIRASVLSIDKAFQIHAANPHDVFVSFVSGRVQHWRRSDTDQQWSYTSYDDKAWGSSLFSIVSRKTHPDINFDGLRLAYNTAHTMTRVGQYLFTACLNHTLRVWHLETGKLVDSRDLLDEARDAQNAVQLNPAEPGYMQFLEGAAKHEQILLTYSPLHGGQVKLWRVRNSFADEINLLTIEDMVPNSTLSLPDPDPTGNSVWSLAGLRVTFDKHTKDWQVWVLWRNYNYHKAYTLNFGFADISNQWRKNWVGVSTIDTKAQGPDFVLADAQDVVSKWLEYVLFPGRYSKAVIETALSQYSNALDIRLAAGEEGKSLEERLSRTVACQVTLRKYDESVMDYDRYAIDIDQQWRQFWRILEGMNEGRYAPLSLASDAVTGTTLLTMADACCFIRECNNLELLQTNQASDLAMLPQITRSRWPYRKLSSSLQDAESVQVFLAAASKFFCSFPPELASNFLQVLEEDLYTDSEVETPTRVVNFFNQIDFANAVPDDVEREFLKELSPLGGFEGITNDIFTVILQLISEHKTRHGKPHQVKTAFGVQITSVALLDEILATKEVLLSLLAVVIFVDETEQFDTSQFFDEIVRRLKTVERNLWIATHHRSSRSPSASGSRVTVSILEDLYANSVRPQPTEHHPMPYILTQHIKDNLEFISGESSAAPAAPEEVAVYLLCNLLKRGNTQLAAEFLKFQPSTPWSTYVKGRLSLALSRNKEASLYFREASTGLSRGKALGKMQDLSDGLLTAEEAACFFNGPAFYFQHILILFEGAQDFSEAAEMAHLVLQSVKPDQSEPIPNFRQSVLLRLFKAYLKCSKFNHCWNTLCQFSDPVLQRASVTDLVDTMLDSGSSLTDTADTVQKIQSLPWAAYPQLASHVDQHLAFLAKKQTSIPSAGGQWLSSSSVDYLSILHALRLSKKDYRGAVSVLFDRLRIVQKSGRARSDPQATSIRHALLAIINAMTCVPDDEAYIIANATEDPRTGGMRLKRIRGQEDEENPLSRKRQKIIITMDDLRREYQKVLDRCSRIERGDFEFNDGGEESDEEDDDGRWQGSKLTVDKGKINGALQLSNGDAMQIG